MNSCRSYHFLGNQLVCWNIVKVRKNYETFKHMIKMFFKYIASKSSDSFVQFWVPLLQLCNFNYVLKLSNPLFHTFFFPTYIFAYRYILSNLWTGYKRVWGGGSRVAATVKNDEKILSTRFDARYQECKVLWSGAYFAPPRTSRISGLKSQILKPTFLS